MFQFDEEIGSRRVTRNPPSYETRYLATGSDNTAFIENYALAYVPRSYVTANGQLYLQDLRIEEEDHLIYHVVAPYGPRKKEEGGDEGDGIEFDFDTSGGTQNIKVARPHITSIHREDSGRTDTDPHEGTIGVAQDGTIEGVNIVVPALKFSVPIRFEPGLVTTAYMKTLAGATGCMSANPFMGFDAFELLFMGAHGKGGNKAAGDVVFNFVASQNAINVTAGGLTFTKLGHDYAWFEFESAVSSDGAAIRRPLSVHVERVYPTPIDFASTFGWGG